MGSPLMSGDLRSTIKMGYAQFVNNLRVDVGYPVIIDMRTAFLEDYWTIAAIAHCLRGSLPGGLEPPPTI